MSILRLVELNELCEKLKFSALSGYWKSIVLAGYCLEVSLSTVYGQRNMVELSTPANFFQFNQILVDPCDKAIGHLNFSIRVFPEDICQGRIDWYLFWILKRYHSTFVPTLSKLVREYTLFYFGINLVLRDILIAASDLTICLVSW